MSRLFFLFLGILFLFYQTDSAVIHQENTAAEETPNSNNNLEYDEHTNKKTLTILIVVGSVGAAIAGVVLCAMRDWDEEQTEDARTTCKCCLEMVITIFEICK